MVSNIWSVCIFFFSSRRRHTRYWRDWSSDVCSSDLPGSPAGDYSPDWSPDGDALVFVSDRDDPEGDVYRMAADGTEVTRLTATPFVTDYSPSWSPNGRHIAFGSTLAGFDNPEVYRMRTDGSGLRRLTRTADGVWDDNPEYSPDGRRSEERRVGEEGRSRW